MSAERRLKKSDSTTESEPDGPEPAAEVQRNIVRGESHRYDIICSIHLGSGGHTKQISSSNITGKELSDIFRKGDIIHAPASFIHGGEISAVCASLRSLAAKGLRFEK
jgi:hypothetical protein